MKTFSIVVINILIILTISEVRSQEIKGNGNVVKKEREILPFSSIKIRDGWDLVLSQGEKYMLIIEADENLIDKVITEVNDGELNIYSDANIIKAKERKIHLTFKDLNSITASGGSDIISETIIKANDFSVNLSEKSDISIIRINTNKFTGTFRNMSDANISFISVENIDIDASGGSDVKLKEVSSNSCTIRLGHISSAYIEGHVNLLDIIANDGGSVKAHELDVLRECKLYLSGNSSANLTILGSIKATLRGGSNLNLKGDSQFKEIDVCKNCNYKSKD